MRTVKKNSRVFIILIAVIFAVLSLGNFSYSANAAFGPPTSAGGDGCLPDPPGDPDCVDRGVPDKCPKIAGSAGLIPCGRDYNDPDTDWDECEPCDFCLMILSGQLIIEFLFKIAAVIAVFSIVLGGFLYIAAAGNQGIMEKAKSTIKYVLLGFLVVLIAWAVVDSILAMSGYIDPIGGEWYAMNC
jgi:hypothetical protein